MKKLTDEEIIKTIIETLGPSLGAEKIALFGSFARKDGHENSDIDILVKLPPLSSRKTIGLNWFSIDEQLCAKIGRKVDIVSEDALSDDLRKIINKDLKLIYEKTG